LHSPDTSLEDCEDYPDDPADRRCGVVDCGQGYDKDTCDYTVESEDWD
jgi:hypothetical protein